MDIDIVKVFGAIIFALIIFVAFGGTFREMATNRDYGYPTNLSSNFNISFMNSDDASKLINSTTDIAYNMTNKVRDSKYDSNTFNLNFMMTTARDIASTIFQGFNFAKVMIGTIITTIGIPKIIFTAIMTLIAFALAVYVAKIFLGRYL